MALSLSTGWGLAEIMNLDCAELVLWGAELEEAKRKAGEG
ncbi:MAG: hypothetical protein FD177_2407 [Desulfovibrionaceae bacterium]|nr:MAG: hypothetical protein FD177_2407 [Desulfovibrionaceae bacterium]